MPFINDRPVDEADVPINVHIESTMSDVALPAYSSPSLAKIKGELTRVLRTFTDEQSQAHFRQALTTLEPQLSPAYKACVQELLLSLPAPLSSSSSSIAFSLEKPAECPVKSATILVRALADVYTSRATLDVIGSDGASIRFETKQLSEVFATIRRSGPNSNTIATFSGSRHVVIWKGDRVYQIDIFDEIGTPFSIARMKAKNQGGSMLVSSSLSQATSFASLSTLLDRRRWASKYGRLKSNNLEAVKAMESSIVTKSLHDNAIEDIQVRLKATREDESVYSDKTLGFSVLSNGGIGGRANHTVVDGGVLVRLLAVLHSAMTKVSLPEESDKGSDAERCGVRELRCDFTASKAATVTQTVNGPTPKRMTFDIPQPADVLDLLRSTSVLGFTVQLAFQAALFALDQSPPGLLVEPVSLRTFKEGRCDPSYLVSEETIALIRAAATGESEDKLLAAFIGAMMAYRKQAKETRGGAGVGPRIIMLRKSVELLPDSIRTASFSASCDYFNDRRSTSLACRQPGL